MADVDAIAIPPRVKDLTGHPPFGRLTVVAFAGIASNRKATWRCLCDCGNETVVTGVDLRSGHSQSCGCLMGERLIASLTTHGRSGTPEHSSWKQMRQRCLNPKNNAYDRYGGRGIVICQRWLDSFADFYADMGPKPSPKHSIERRENDGNYEPGNCYWATPKQQNRNTRKNVMLTFDGRTQCIGAWAEELGMGLRTLWTRLNDGWSVERALTEPVH
jgi:hypothetical protein